tara:strand:- start:13245 stop:14369 length:1125 start_codon:yes stop_codon:yes gene_type:complete
MNRNIIFIQDRPSTNIYFLIYITSLLKTKNISLKQFISNKCLISENDVILYYTWPDDRLFQHGPAKGPAKGPIYNNTKYHILKGKNHRKFNKSLTEKADLKFLKLPNKLKILVDLFDCSTEDAYSRFNDENYLFLDENLKSFIANIKKVNKNYFYQIPRIKNTTCLEYKNKFNVIFNTISGLSKRQDYKTDMKSLEINANTSIKFHFSCSLKHNIYRTKIYENLQNINKKNNMIHLEKLDKYPDSLRDVMCEIVVPGWGICTYRMYDALYKGCLLLLYENNDNIDKTIIYSMDECCNINQCEFFPISKLVENQDFISFNLTNLEEKLDFINNNSETINKIRQNGHIKFIENVNFNELSKLLLSKISSETYYEKV